MRFSLLIILSVLNLVLNAQAPALIPYQAVARDAAGQALNNATINARFTIHDGAATGAVVWQELQTVTTTALGLFTAQLGSSVPLTGVNWANGNKFMQVEIDLGQGFVDMGTQQLLSVPYALFSSNAQHAENSGNGYSHVSLSGDTLYFQNGEFVIIPGISQANSEDNNIESCDLSSLLNSDLVYGSMIDQEGNVYKTIVIGTDEWMAENLRTSIYRNGDAIPTDLSNEIWQNTNSGAWAYYNDDASYACPYGKLYNWYTCVDSRQLCPVGWHVPSDTEWSVFINFLDPTANGGDNIFNIAGGQMKTTGIVETLTGLWYTPNVGATNSSGFSGVPAGYRNVNGSFDTIGIYSFWWSSSENDTTFAWNRSLINSRDDANRFANEKHFGFSVRCLRD
jgi:uncharacterized protein (TIGR02145 family)